LAFRQIPVCNQDDISTGCYAVTDVIQNEDQKV
jgi:hypothetical protein